MVVLLSDHQLSVRGRLSALRVTLGEQIKISVVSLLTLILPYELKEGTDTSISPTIA